MSARPPSGPLTAPTDALRGAPAVRWTGQPFAELRDVVHGFTSRAHGTTRAPEAAPATPDAVDRLLDAESAASGAADGWRRCGLRQVHGAVVVCDPARQALEGDPPRADGIVLTGTGRLAVVRTADCQAVLLAAVDGLGVTRAVGALHAGWRGLLRGIVPATVGTLRRVAPDCTLRAALGPSIGPCCFEVGEEVAEGFRARLGPGFLVARPGHRVHADLPGSVARELTTLGAALVGGPPPCTRCAPLEWHSHRADGAAAGRLAAFIGLRPPQRAP